ncbi:hypothetical protein, conserved [Babesia ovata]|uniref:Uncharacterized protein n=1 Tax=Babesia ovata TaxID=189622 RepID=A0A2H6K8N6_9APIC|nr:uncharacterized protein BOVATA_008440 [Babesia ovata]GBE59351.1 hypothetical protein, conserved [Babesia ovata]
MVRQPKKLTDCPENLRESIDWLIQVKHGNGEHGLKSLAEALQKLIGEAIKDARESLNERQDQLSCSKSSGYPHCQSLDAQIDQAKESLKSEKSNGKSKNESQLVKLENDLNKLKSEKEKHYNDVHYLTEDARYAQLKDIADRQTTLKVLQKDLEAFIGKQEVKDANEIPATKILEKLTEGAETFLGFNSDSKGYDGSGIVYADLDRLCDGVMAFLHGVLESVKEDDAVTKYDGYIVPENQRLDQLLKTLKSSIGEGSDAFGKQVTAVGDWLGRYEGEVKDYNKQVIKAIDDFNKEFEKHDYNNLMKHNIGYQHEQWRKEVETYAQHVRNAKGALNDVDSNLQIKLESPIGKIESALEVLQKSSENEELAERINKVDKELVKQAIKVEKEIMKQCLKVGEKLYDGVQGIFKSVRALTECKTSYFGGIKSALDEARNLVDKVDGEYKGEIVGKFDAIKHKVIEVHDKLFTKKAQLLQLVGSAKQHFVAIQNGVGTESLGNSIYHHWDLLKKQMIKFIGELYDEAGRDGKPNHLGTIKQGVVNFAKGFSEGKLNENVLKTWVTEIMDKKPMSGMIDFWLQMYVKEVGNKGHFRDPLLPEEQKLTSVKDAIQSALPGYIEGVIQEAASAAELQSATVGNSVDKFGRFAQNIEKEFMVPNVESTVETIEMAVGLTPKTTSNEHLKSAITYVLNCVALSAKKLAEQLQRFAAESTIHRIDNAIKCVEKIGEEFQESRGDHGQHITDALVKVTSNIDSLGTFLGKTLDRDGSIQKKLKDIQTEVIDKLDNLQKAKDNDGNNDGEIIKKRNETDVLMEKLKYKIRDMLIDVTEAVSQADETISHAINDVQHALSEADNNNKKAVESLRNNLIHGVRRTFQELTSQARKLFARQKQADLKALQTIVEEQKEKLQEIIKMNVNSSLKGFLAKLQNKFINPLKVFVPKLVASGKQKKEKDFHHLAEKLNNCFSYFIQQLKMQEDYKVLHFIFKPSRDALTDLLTDLYGTNHFDHKFTDNLTSLENTLNDFAPKKFHAPDSILLDALKAGMIKFTTELSHAYVNKYSGRILNNVFEPQKPGATPPTEQVLSTEGRNCAKVCLTILERVSLDLSKLRVECNKSGGNWKNSHIRLYDWDTIKKTKSVNELGTYLEKHGFRVPEDENNQNGELDKDVKGDKIRDLLVNESSTKHVYRVDDRATDEGPLRKIHKHLHEYYKLTHHEHIPSPKSPSNICHMLQWLTGLQWNPMFGKVCDHAKELFDKPDDQKDEPYDKIDTRKLTLSATTRITWKDIKETLDKVCYHSEKMLINILGHGHPDGRFACDFNTNPDKFSYPNSPGACFDMLVDILNRVFYQLRFLCSQCHNGPKSGGWADCWYGRGIGGSAWSCNSNQCPNQIGNQPCNQKCDQTGSQHANCGVKSPLQSFLEDGLPGFLPHQFSTPGCKLTCTVRDHTGKSCLTPMGFADIGVAASHTKTGWQLFGALYRFCGLGSELHKLCSQLNCVLRRAPQTLGDMFGFYYNFLANWNGRIEHRKTAFNDAVKKANFWNDETMLEITSMFGSGNHSSHTSKDNTNYLTGDLFSLVECKDAALPCGPFMQSINVDILTTFSSKRADNYLSWVTHITETFFGLLYDLYESCKKCDKPGIRCCDKSCAENCAVRYTDEDGKPKSPSVSDKHTIYCHSIVKCPDMYPTLYKRIHLGDTRTILHYTPRPLVPLFALPAARLSRPPRHPEDPLPPALALIAPHHRPVATRSGACQPTWKDEILLTVIIPSRVI